MLIVSPTSIVMPSSPNSSGAIVRLPDERKYRRGAAGVMREHREFRLHHPEHSAGLQRVGMVVEDRLRLSSCRTTVGKQFVGWPREYRILLRPCADFVDQEIGALGKLDKVLDGRVSPDKTTECCRYSTR